MGLHPNYTFINSALYKKPSIDLCEWLLFLVRILSDGSCTFSFSLDQWPRTIFHLIIDGFFAFILCVCVYRCPWRTEEGSDPLGLDLGSCELLDMCAWKWTLHPWDATNTLKLWPISPVPEVNFFVPIFLPACWAPVGSANVCYFFCRTYVCSRYGHFLNQLKRPANWVSS